MPVKNHVRLAVAILLVAAIASYGWWGPRFGLPVALPSMTELHQWFDGLGAWGPVMVVGLMMFAILVSPVPSAPIALAAGSIYGHFWGALYVLTGSELGAIAAFGIARFLGYDLLHGWLGDRLQRGPAGSQTVLMGTVFVSRLLPFISFDIVSYAAGLTALSFWRFALATLAGIVPASFLLAHFGSELVAQETNRIAIALAVIGAVVAAPLIWRMVAGSRGN